MNEIVIKEYNQKFYVDIYQSYFKYSNYVISHIFWMSGYSSSQEAKQIAFNWLLRYGKNLEINVRLIG